jgi:hypothetical protein
MWGEVAMLSGAEAAPRTFESSFFHSSTLV